MHELGVVMQVVDVVEKFARENQVEKIDTVVLQIGELSSMIPKYVEEVYPAAADGTMPAAGGNHACQRTLQPVRHGVPPGGT